MVTQFGEITPTSGENSIQETYSSVHKRVEFTTQLRQTNNYAKLLKHSMVYNKDSTIILMMELTWNTTLKNPRHKELNLVYTPLIKT